VSIELKRCQRVGVPQDILHHLDIAAYRNEICRQTVPEIVHPKLHLLSLFQHPADGFAERDAALLMLAEKQEGRSSRITVGADKAYDSKNFVRTVRELNVTPHVAKNDKGRTSNLNRRTTRQPGYTISLSRRWLIKRASRG
jgi:hypothetical protein